jgi:hypothetical protein
MKFATGIVILTVSLSVGLPCAYADDSGTNQGWYRLWGGMMGPEGRGMIGPGYGRGYSNKATTAPLTIEQAKEVFNRHLSYTRHSNLKLGKIVDKDTYYEADILTKQGSLVDKLKVDKRTGWILTIDPICGKYRRSWVFLPAQVKYNT